MEDLKAEAHVQALSEQLEPLVRETLHHDERGRFELDVYLGKDPAHTPPRTRRAAVREREPS